MNEANKRVRRFDMPCKEEFCSEITYRTNSDDPSTIWVYLALFALVYVYREYFNSVNACLVMSICPHAQCGAGRL